MRKKFCLITSLILCLVLTLSACGDKPVEKEEIISTENKISTEVEAPETSVEAVEKVAENANTFMPKLWNEPKGDNVIPTDGFAPLIKPIEPPKAEVKEEPKTEVVSLKVIGRNDEVLFNKEVPFKEGMTAFTLFKDNGENVLYKGITGMEYIHSAYGLAERQYGPMSGWVFTIDGKQVNKGASKCKLTEGQKVVWLYANAE